MIQWQSLAIPAINPEASYVFDIDEENNTITNIVWKHGTTPISMEDINAKAEELKAIEEAKPDVKGSAKAKLIAGEALTEEEANTIVL